MSSHKATLRLHRLGAKAQSWLLRQWLRRDSTRAAVLLAHACADGRRLAEIESMIALEIEQHGLDASLAAIHSAIARAGQFAHRDAQRALYAATLRAVREVDLQRAISFGEQYIEQLPDPRALKSLVGFHRVAANYDRALSLIERLPRDDWCERIMPVLVNGSLEQRLEREFADDLRASIALGNAQVNQVARRMFASVGSSDKLPAFRVLRRVLEKAFVANDYLADQLVRYASEITSEKDPDAYIALAACDVHLRSGNLSHALDVLTRLARDNPRAGPKLAQVASMKRFVQEGAAFRPSIAKEPAYVPLARRVLCPLHHCLPYRPDGYATRTHSLLSSLAGRGWHASGVTRLGYPGVLEGREDPVRDCEVGAVSYFHLHASAVDSPVHGVATYEYLVAYCNALLDLARAERPEILHASSNYLNGLAANAVARALGIKSVYEVRGLWEISRVSREPEWKSAELFSVMSRMEAQVAAGADQVVCITHALKEEMVRRGVPEEKITVVSNGVDIERFVPRRRHRELAEELGVAGKKVIGYVGSMSDYEGLDLLLQAIARLRDRGTSAIAAVLVGDGDALASLKQLAEELAIADMVTFTGRVPHDRVEDYYSIIDVAPFPRKSTPVTEIVSPLKPFEAMAMKKIVIASNVAALAEIIEDGVNGLLFQKDDVDDLVSKLETVLAPGFAHALRPREWVVENRSWQRLSGIVEEVYKRLVAVS